MVRIALPLLALAFVSAPVARAGIYYDFDITTAFAAADPFANPIDSNVYDGDTGYL